MIAAFSVSPAGPEDVAAAVAEAVRESPFADRIPGILDEAHALLAGEERKRLSQSD